MEKKLPPILALFALLFAAVACTQVAAPAEVTTEAPASEDVVLDVIGESQSASFTMEALMAMPVVEGQAGTKSSTGKVTPPRAFKGVSLIELINQVGGLGENMGVEIEAEDGYTMTFSGDQIASGDFITYDPATGDEIDYDGTLTAIIAYERDGEMLDEKSDGRLRLVVVGEDNTQVVDGHWSIKWVRKITLKSMAEDWTIELQGGIEEVLDRGAFESCATGTCHAAAWTDGKAQEWSGTPLWYIVGRMDDEFKHGSDVAAFNRDLLAAGYTVEVVAADGYSVTFDGARVADNNDILLANEVNGNPLNDEDFPLRLAGADLSGEERIGAIVKIILHFGESAAAPEATEAATKTEVVVPAGDAALTLTGLVDAEQSWTLDMLKGLDVVTLQLEHPKKGMTEYQGVRLSDLLALAGLKADAAYLLFTAADGFTAEIKLADVQACADCLVAFDDDGSLKLAMPGMDSEAWVKDLIRIEVK